MSHINQKHTSLTSAFFVKKKKKNGEFQSKVTRPHQWCNGLHAHPECGTNVAHGFEFWSGKTKV